MKIYQFLELLTAPLDEFLESLTAPEALLDQFLESLTAPEALLVFRLVRPFALVVTFLLVLVPVLLDVSLGVRFLATVPVLVVFDCPLDAGAALRFLATVPVLVPVLLDVSFLAGAALRFLTPKHASTGDNLQLQHFLNLLVTIPIILNLF